MEGKFNEDGSFAAKRGVNWVNFMCPFTAMSEPCNMECPQMSEPIRQINRQSNRPETVIHICQGRHWKFTAFEDRRTIQ